MISTQVVNITRNEVAERLGMKPEQVNIQPTYMGEVFGDAYIRPTPSRRQ